MTSCFELNIQQFFYKKNCTSFCYKMCTALSFKAKTIYNLNLKASSTVKLSFSKLEGELRLHGFGFLNSDETGHFLQE